MLIVKSVRDRNTGLVPAIVAGLIPSEQEDRSSSWIKRIERPQRPANMLGSKLAHVAVPRSFDPAAMGKTQGWTAFFKQADRGVQGLLLLLGQAIPPVTERVRVLDFPSHEENIAYVEYSVKGI